jgi:hypothetical protein
MSTTDARRDFAAFIPRQIEPERDMKYGLHLAGFPVALLLQRVQPMEAGAKAVIVAAVYEPATSTFVETEQSRELTYLNKAGGKYTIKIILDEANGSVQAFKYKGEEIVAIAAGRDFDSAIIQIGLMGIAPDEPVSFIDRCK